jgi:ferredoxin
VRRAHARARKAFALAFFLLSIGAFVAPLLVSGGLERLLAAIAPGTQLLPALQRAFIFLSPRAGQATGAGLVAAGIVALHLGAAFAAGRFYCSTLCPFGFVQELVADAGRVISHVGSKRRARDPAGSRLADGRYRPGRPFIHGTLAVTALATALAGSSTFLAFIEPYALFGKMASGLARPLVELANNALAALFGLVGSYAIAVAPLSWDVAGVAVGALPLALAGGLVLWRGRLFCELLCPAGALLRVAAAKPLFGLRIDRDACTGCGRCERVCPASCMRPRGEGVDEDRCLRCLECAAACPESAIGFGRIRGMSPAPGAARRSIAPGGAVRGSARPGGAVPDKAVPGSITSGDAEPVSVEAGIRPLISRGVFLSKLALAAPLVAGCAAFVPLFAKAAARREPGAFMAGRLRVPALPPGAGDMDRFLARCTACGLCSAVCPSGVIAPASSQWGLLDPAKPFLAYDRAYCQFECDLCLRSCPTGALRPMGLEEKKATSVGRSVLLLNLCIVLTKGTSCGACAEHCPSGAIAMVRASLGGPPRPVLDTAYCIGCGACETVCPAKPEKAIYVEGRTRQTRAAVLESRPGDARLRSEGGRPPLLPGIDTESEGGVPAPTGEKDEGFPF